MRRATVALALLLPALAACSSSNAEEAAEQSLAEQAATAWESDVEEALGSETVDMPALQQQAAADCERTSAELWTVSLALSGARSATDLTRIGLTHACPDVVAAYDEAVETVDAAADPLTLACKPGVEMTAADAQLAEMACAGR